MDPDVVTRFAPSPTGALHPGNARTALFSFLLARRSSGRFIVRVEDTDRERGSESYVAAQLADLAWLGIDFDAGPGREDDRGPYRQSERGSLYSGLFERLGREGHAYPCYCTPAELEVARRTQLAAGEPPRYPGTCRGLDDAARAARAAGGRKRSVALCDTRPGNPAFRRPGPRPAGGGVGDARRFSRAARRRWRRVFLLQRRGRRAHGRDTRSARRRSPQQHAAPAPRAARSRDAGASLWPPAAAARRGRRAAVQAARQRDSRGTAGSRLPCRGARQLPAATRPSRRAGRLGRAA